MSKFWRTASSDESEVFICFHCPGCEYDHAFRVRGKDPVWGWNENLEKPTFTPSLLVNQHHPESRCHSFVVMGHIQFLNDCHHALKNKTVEIHDDPRA